ncbi:MAG: glycerate kinase [Acidobacteriota bacterium]
MKSRQVDFLLDLFDAAVGSANPSKCLPPHLPGRNPAGRTVIFGAGKAAASMARVVEVHWEGALSGLAVTPYRHRLPCKWVEVLEAGHPFPDRAGENAANRILEMARELRSGDLALCLFSGGGSALLPVPPPGLKLEDKREISKALILSGAGIAELNCVRKHLSSIKGGRLAIACAPAAVMNLLISDVPGDDPAVIASGPTVADPTTLDQAIGVLEKYDLTEPFRAYEYLRTSGEETPKSDDRRLGPIRTVIVASGRTALDAAAARANQSGIRPRILGNDIVGESREVARTHAGIARRAARNDTSGDTPVVILSGGETTVTVRGNGRGGPNTEYLLALAISLNGHPGIYAIACDTDGIDGSGKNAGALMTPDTLARAAEIGLDPRASLENNDGYEFFAALDDLIVTGPTRTNVNDFRAILVTGETQPAGKPRGA